MTDCVCGAPSLLVTSCRGDQAGSSFGADWCSADNQESSEEGSPLGNRRLFPQVKASPLHEDQIPFIGVNALGSQRAPGIRSQARGGAPGSRTQQAVSTVARVRRCTPSRCGAAPPGKTGRFWGKRWWSDPSSWSSSLL